MQGQNQWCALEFRGGLGEVEQSSRSARRPRGSNPAVIDPGFRRTESYAGFFGERLRATTAEVVRECDCARNAHEFPA